MCVCLYVHVCVHLSYRPIKYLVHIATDSGIMLKSLLNVTAFIKKTQLFMYE